MVSKRLIAVAAAALVAVALSLLLGGSDRGGSGSGARVVRVVDGDTLKVAIGGREQSVRLLGIDTPETHRPGVAIECGGPEASAHMVGLAPPGTPVTLEPDPGQDRVDRYGRLLAYVRLPDGRLAEEAQVGAGWATVYVFDGHPVARDGQFRRAMGAARAAGRGVWRLCGGDFHSEGR
ncbi:MAG: micrococcal nuclease [Thermoleophilaceae bacterium]|nr:micrococcal nuclease [Thermoleophilaceae bacterium]